MGFVMRATEAKPVAQEDNQQLAQRLRRWLDRLGPLMAVLVITVASAAGATLYFSLAKPLERAVAAVRQHDTTRLDTRVKEMGTAIERLLPTVVAWSRSDLVSVDAPATFNRLMMPVIESRPLISSVHLATDAGAELLLLRTPTGWKNRLTHMATQGTRQHWLEWRDAKTQIGDECKEADYDPRKRPGVSGALGGAEGKVHLTAPYLFQSTQEPGITAAMHYPDTLSGQKRVVAFDLLLTDLSRFTSELSFR